MAGKFKRRNTVFLKMLWYDSLNEYLVDLTAYISKKVWDAYLCVFPLQIIFNTQLKINAKQICLVVATLQV